MSPIISVENLSKAYRIGVAEEKHDTLAATVASWVKAPFRNLKRLSSLNTSSSLSAPRSSPPASDSSLPAPSPSPLAPSSQPPASDIHWALRDVSFEVNEGEVVGIIGHNGAGKSTLLKILSRITDPTSGRAVIRGRVSSLLEVGTGFHPELSGRDNIYMNGTILGMRKKEIDRKIEQIIAFSGVEKFLDTPVKRYSSGMKVRLAFSVAAHLEPEILIIDEVLAVGDQSFQDRCLGKMNEIASGGRTVLFVSHNLTAVRSLCNRTVMLKHGAVESDGSTREVLDRYLATAPSVALTDATYIRNPEQLVNKTIAITRVETHRHQMLSSYFDCDDEIYIDATYIAKRKVHGLYGYINVYSADGTMVYEGDSFDAVANPFEAVCEGSGTFIVTIPRRTFSPGRYRVDLSMASRTDIAGPVLDAPGVVAEFRVSDASTVRGNRRKGYLSCRCGWAVSQQN